DGHVTGVQTCALPICLKGIGTITLPTTFVQTYLTETPVLPTSGSTSYVNLALLTSDDSVPAGTAVPQASPAVNVLTGSDRVTMRSEERRVGKECRYEV